MVSFSHQVIAVSPQLCPMSMAATLVSVGNDEGDDADRLRSACVATLCELGKLVFFYHVLLLKKLLLSLIIFHSVLKYYFCLFNWRPTC